MKTVSIFLALINSLLAGLLLAFSLSPIEIRHTATWWVLTKTTAASLVILVGLITWLGGMRSLPASWMALCSLFLVALGAAIAAWTFHLALVSGDMEFYIVIYGGSLAVQGMASLFGFGGDSKHVVSL